MRVTGPCTTAEMLWDWARAEWESSRFGVLYPDVPEAVARLRNGAPYDHAQVFDQRIASTVAHVREVLLKDLLPARLAWHRAMLPSDALGALRVMHSGEVYAVTHSPLLRDLAAALEAELRRPSARLAEQPLVLAYREIAESFDPDAMRGAPLLLACDLQGPFHILEGHRRLAALCARFADGRLAPRETAVILGIWPELKSWKWYRDVSPADRPSGQPLK